ncbi:MAG TPA: hypothetical protein VFB79_23355 [Candidatus Angelobacter sp.]|nr:hypothetical protein [Candidatus Angelobacter sp.]
MRVRALSLIVLTCALLCTNSSAADRKVVESNEKGDITLTQPTRVGNLTLQPGTYSIEEHGSHGQHFLRFQQVKYSTDLEANWSYTGWVKNRHLTEAGKVDCEQQPLEKKAKSTVADIINDGEAQRISQLTVKGKKVSCVF